MPIVCGSTLSWKQRGSFARLKEQKQQDAQCYNRCYQHRKNWAEDAASQKWDLRLSTSLHSFFWHYKYYVKGELVWKHWLLQFFWLQTTLRNMFTSQLNTHIHTHSHIYKLKNKTKTTYTYPYYTWCTLILPIALFKNKNKNAYK